MRLVQGFLDWIGLLGGLGVLAVQMLSFHAPRLDRFRFSRWPWLPRRFGSRLLLFKLRRPRLVLRGLGYLVLRLQRQHEIVQRVRDAAVAGLQDLLLHRQRALEE